MRLYLTSALTLTNCTNKQVRVLCRPETKTPTQLMSFKPDLTEQGMTYICDWLSELRCYPTHSSESCLIVFFMSKYSQKNGGSSGLLVGHPDGPTQMASLKK